MRHERVVVALAVAFLPLEEAELFISVGPFRAY